MFASFSFGHQEIYDPTIYIEGEDNARTNVSTEWRP